ncbi:MAG: hypothetical protein ACXWV4_05675 [Flavitalea sp.]
MPKVFLFLFFAAFIWSCSNENKYNYAIRDFRKPLQPHLQRIVTKGIVMHFDSALKNIATDKELIQLSQSEHPVLRASAFREMLERKSFNQYDLILNHLDDTAMVLADMGEFGIPMRKVSDDILLSTFWESRQSRHKIVVKILKEHNYLRAAYSILELLEPQEDLYPFVKAMATRPRLISMDGYELYFDDIEYALYGLAKFKKEADIQVIKDQMMENVWQMSNISLKIIEEFPDARYYEVLEEYHRRFFYGFSGNRRNGFSGYRVDNADPEDFIRALVMQKSGSSAILLDTILNRLPRQICMPDKNGIMRELVLAIWEHPCPAYKELLEKIRPEAERFLKGRQIITIERDNIDTTGGVIGWYN